ncbi:MAG: hypothetical protein EA369_04670 [Bradymonadales bacterium]|nr:MAG: hypothetical protein EA369_04670 [Bradymonadales bacterium]
MKRGKSFPGMSDDLYTGRCDTCGERYEAQSGTEDLEGLRFRCRALLCSGSVELRHTGSVHVAQHSKMSGGFEIREAPKKFC